MSQSHASSLVMRQKAVTLLAAGKLQIQEIAKQVGVSEKTLANWRADAAFKQELKLAANAWRGKARNEGISDKDRRLRASNNDHARLESLMNQRARSPEMQGVTGGDTGLLTISYKMKSMGEGKGSEAQPEYSFDAAVIEKRMALREEVAIALGHIKLKPKMDIQVGAVNMTVLMAKINAGHERVAKAKAERDARRAATRELPGS